ncbi:acetate uptake transporter family protein [Glycomyces halotolerans]
MSDRDRPERRDALRESETSAARIVLRPVGTPLPLGFLGLLVATVSFSALQLGWIPASQSANVALVALGLTVPVQLLASVFGFLCRDPVAGTGMGILAGTWAAAGLATLTSPPGATSPGLGIALLAAGTAMLVPAAGGRHKAVAAAVMAASAVRFMVTGVAEFSGSAGWMTAAGWTGLVLAAVALYAALAFELEDSERRDVLPVWRTGGAASAVSGDSSAQLEDIVREPGARKQL